MTEKRMFSLEKWKMLIQEQKNSGMTVCEWCTANGYTKDAYYYWLKQLRTANLPAALEQLKEPAVVQTFVDVTPAEPGIKETGAYPGVPSAVIRKNGMEIGLFRSASADLIRLLLECVKNA